MATADEPSSEELHTKLHRWAGLLRSRGVAALLDSISATEAVPERVLARLGGERRLTDLGSCRPTAAHRRDRATARCLRADRLAAAADHRRRPRRRRRGSHPAPRLGRRGRPGADDPSQQGPRVPDRLPPVRLAARLHRPGRAACLPRRPERRRLDDRRRRQRPRHRSAPPAPQPRATRRGPPPPLCRAHPHDAPGDRLVGRLIRIPLLVARPAPLRARRRRRRRRRGDRRTLGRRGRRTPRKRSPRRRRAGSRSSGSRRRPARTGPPSPTPRPISKRRASIAHSTPAGDASPTAASSPPSTRSRWRASPSSSSSTTSRHPRATADDATSSPDTEEQQLRAALGAARRDARRRRRRRPPPPRAGGDRLRSRRPRDRTRTAARRAAPPPRRRDRRRRHRRSPGLPAQSRRRSGPCWGRSGSATSLPPTGSTSSTSSCRSSAATDRRAPSPCPISPHCSRRTFPPMTRCAATPNGCATHSCAGICAATSPGHSTSSSAPAARTAPPATPSSTTRATGSAPTERTSAPGTTVRPHSQRRCSARTTRCKR